MSRYIHDKVNHQLIPVSGYGSRMATSIEDKTLTIHGSYTNVEGYNYGKADITDAVELIAPIETELVASRAYSVGKQFVYRGFLYKVTAPIALDETIVIGTNCELAPDVSEQIRTLSNSQIQIMTKVVSGTTNSYGDISLGLNNAYCVLACGIKDDGGGVFAIPRLISAGNWYATCYSANAKMQSKSVAVTVYYCSI